MARQLDEDQTAVRRSRRIALSAGAILIGMLFLLPAGYWGAVNYVPPFREEPPALPRQNGYELALRALHGFGEVGVLDGRWQTMSLPALEVRLRRRRTTLAAVRAAFALEWRVPDSLEPGEAYHGGPFYECSAWFAAESRLARARGDYDAAMRHCLDAIELGARACRGGDEGDRGTGQGCQERGLKEAQRVVWHLPRKRLPEHLARIHRLRTTWPPITATLEVERLQARRECIALFTELRGKTPWDQATAIPEQPVSTSTLVQAGSGHSDLSWDAWKQVLTPRAVSLARLDRFYRELAAASTQPAPHGVPVPEMTDLWVSRFTRTSYTGCYRGEWPRHNLALLETALAVRLFRLERGAYPASLAKISRRWLPEVPRDVWDQPVRYLRRRGEPVVYSLGPDGVDDSAVPADPSSFVRAGRGDSVFGKLCGIDWLH